MRVDLILFFVLFLIPAPTSQAAAIHEAAKKGDVAALDSGVDANASNGIATPLYYAIDGGHLEAAKLLLGRGADVEAQRIWGPALVPEHSSLIARIYQAEPRR
jgi:cytochrome c